MCLEFRTKNASKEIILGLSDFFFVDFKEAFNKYYYTEYKKFLFLFLGINNPTS